MTHNTKIDSLARKIEALRLLSPVGYPWAAKEIERLEAELAALLQPKKS